MRAALIIIGVILIGAGAIALLIAEQPFTDFEVRQTAVSGSGVSADPDADTDTDVETDKVAAADGKPDRIVGKELIATPEIETKQLERLPAREPLSNPNLAADHEKGKSRLLFRPVAVAAGIFEAQGHRIRISGVEPTDPDTVCDDESGGSRPCGMQALTAFRYWLRGRALECDLDGSEQQEPEQDTITATCRLGEQDAGAWLVKYGWARAEEDGRYSKLEASARQNAQGIFALSN